MISLVLAGGYVFDLAGVWIRFGSFRFGGFCCGFCWRGDCAMVLLLTNWFVSVLGACFVGWRL